MATDLVFEGQEGVFKNELPSEKKSERDWTPFVAVYEELRKIADRQVKSPGDQHSLGPTGLVHETLLRLIQDEITSRVNDPQYLFGAALRAMGRVLVDRARARKRLKRGGQFQRLSLDQVLEYFEAQSVDFEELHEALARLAQFDERRSQVMSMRYFLQMTNQEIANHFRVSLSKVESDLRMGRAWLRRELTTPFL